MNPIVDYKIRSNDAVAGNNDSKGEIQHQFKIVTPSFTSSEIQQL